MKNLSRLSQRGVADDFSFVHSLCDAAIQCTARLSPQDPQFTASQPKLWQKPAVNLQKEHFGSTVRLCI